MDANTFRTENTHFEHCIKLKKPNNNLKFIADITAVLQLRINSKFNRHYKTYSDTEYHYYCFKEYEHARFLEEWIHQREPNYYT